MVSILEHNPTLTHPTPLTLFSIPWASAPNVPDCTYWLENTLSRSCTLQKHGVVAVVVTVVVVVVVVGGGGGGGDDGGGGGGVVAVVVAVVGWNVLNVLGVRDVYVKVRANA